jgi:ubiquinone/menaquinone biosynthesis C-methylase UbiE
MPRPTQLTELMDDPHVDPAALAVSLRFIRGVNRYLGGTRAILTHLRRWSQHWPAQEPLTILDVATGSADIPLAITRWAARTGRNVSLLALDLHPTTLALARDWVAAQSPPSSPPPIQFVRGDALALPLADRSVDYAISSMFFHHLTDEQAVAALKEMLRVARRGIVVNDLLRTPFARLGIGLLTLRADAIDRHDARVSVRKAWTRREVEGWPARVAAPWLHYRYHGFARFTLAGAWPA